MNRLSSFHCMYSSAYFYGLQKLLQRTVNGILELKFVTSVEPQNALIKSITVGAGNRIQLLVNSKCREFAINSLQTKNSSQVLLHLYDMCRSKEAQVLVMKIKNTVALSSDESLDFNHVVNTVSPRCWAWMPKEKESLLLTDLASVPGLNKRISHVCLEGHSEWQNYAELI